MLLPSDRELQIVLKEPQHHILSFSISCWFSKWPLKSIVGSREIIRRITEYSLFTMCMCALFKFSQLNLKRTAPVVILLFLFCRQEAFSPDLRLWCTDVHLSTLCCQSGEDLFFICLCFAAYACMFCPFVVLNCSALSLRATIHTVCQCIIGSKTLRWNWTSLQL